MCVFTKSLINKQTNEQDFTFLKWLIILYSKKVEICRVSTLPPERYNATRLASQRSAGRVGRRAKDEQRTAKG